MSTYEIESHVLDEQETAVEFATLPIAEIGPFLQKAFAEVAVCLQRKGAGPAGMPFARYHPAGDDRLEVEAGFPASTPTSGEGDVEPSDLPGGLAAVTVHVGSYDAVAPAYAALRDWVREHGGEPTGPPWEVYLTHPANDAGPAGLRTEIVQPYRVP